MGKVNLGDLIAETAKIKKQLDEKKQQIDEHEEYKKLKQEEADLKASYYQMRDELQFAMQDAGVQTFKTDHGGASITWKKGVIRVTNPEAAVDYIMRERKDELPIYTKLNDTAYKGLAAAALEQTGEVLEGVEVRDEQQLNFRVPKPKDEGAK